MNYSGARCGQGALDPREFDDEGRRDKPFGIVRVEKLAGKGEHARWLEGRSYPKPGDRAYDLMC